MSHPVQNNQPPKAMVQPQTAAQPSATKALEAPHLRTIVAMSGPRIIRNKLVIAPTAPHMLPRVTNIPMPGNVFIAPKGCLLLGNNTRLMKVQETANYDNGKVFSHLNRIPGIQAKL